MKSLSTVTLGELVNIGWVLDFFPIAVGCGLLGKKKIQNEITTTHNYFKNLTN